MLEIHRRYVLDESGEPVAVQIPIGQFESLLSLLPQQVRVMDELGLPDEVLRQAVAVGLAAVEQGDYEDCDEAGVAALFDRVKQKGRLQRGIQA
jgi:hypothetical protein